MKVDRPGGQHRSAARAASARHHLRGLALLNEQLIYASFTGYGETGPEADKPGFDATAWWARSGLMHLVRAGAETAPGAVLSGVGRPPSAMATYGPIMTALYQQERTERYDRSLSEGRV
jgi:crotonobetainyl-CoA:carnitine CoA-transferase CaiB-like acyl-CoA transferase